VVKKRRRLFLLNNIRVHVDHVDSLGHFVELEAVVPQGSVVEEQSEALAQVRDALGIRQHHILGESYSDLLELALAG
jgi:predicted adenylyl cyclase CyaB